MRLALLLLGCLFAAPAAADTWRYVDDHGNVGYADDPGKIPSRYRDRATRLDSKDKDEGLSLLDRVRQVFEPVELPQRQGAEPTGRGQRDSDARQSPGGGAADGAASGHGPGRGSADAGRSRTGAGSAGGSGGSSGAGTPGQGGAGGAQPQLNADALQQLLDQFPTDRLTRKAVLAAVAMWASGLFWVIIGAIVLIGYILATRSLIELVDSQRMQMFWRWGFPVLSGIAIALLGAWRYRAWRELYTEMCRLAGF